MPSPISKSRKYAHPSYFSTMEQMLGRPLVNQLLVDKNPSATDDIPIFLRVFPECFYIIALRDPRDVVLSCFFQDLPLSVGTVRFQSLKDTAMRYANTMAMWLISRDKLDEAKWVELKYESVVNNLPAEVQRVMNKLHLHLEPAQLQPNIHAQNKTVWSPTYAEVAKPINSAGIGKWKRYEPWIAEVTPDPGTVYCAFNY